MATIKPYEFIDNDTFAAFIEEATDELLPRQHTMWILDNFLTSPRDVCDLYVDDKRVAVAFLIPLKSSDHRIFELTAIPIDDNPFLTTRILEWASQRLKGRPHDRLEIPIWMGSRVSRKTIQSLGYLKRHTMYHMEGVRRELKTPEAHILPQGWKWKLFDMNYLERFHRTVTAAFHKIPGAFIPDLEKYREITPTFKIAPMMLLDEHDDVAGFVRVSLVRDGVGELSSLGRSPLYKGNGLGEMIVLKGIEMLAERRVDFIILEVAGKNRKAIALYEKFGFGLSGSTDVFSDKQMEED